MKLKENAYVIYTGVVDVSENEWVNVANECLVILEWASTKKVQFQSAKQ